MADRRDDTEKQDRLREAGTLNRTPEKVSDPMFAAGDFFDARDLLQVRYEMVRLVRVDEAEPRAGGGAVRGLAADLLPHGQGVRRGRAAGAHPRRGAGREDRTRSARRSCASSRTTGPGTAGWERAGWPR